MRTRTIAGAAAIVLAFAASRALAQRGGGGASQPGDTGTPTWKPCHSSKNPDERIAACTHELDQLPGAYAKADLFDNRGLAHLDKGEYDAALQDIGRAIKERSDEGVLHFHRGLVYLRMGDHERALQAFDVALVHAHDLAPALVARGHERLYRHEDDKALEDLDRAVRLYPTYPDAFGERCFARAVTGRDLEAAKADCETAIRLAPDSVEFIGTRALLEFKRGERDKALADLDAVLAKQPGAINALYLRGLVKRDLGDAPGAKADLDLALARHPQIAAEWAVFGVR